VVVVHIITTLLALADRAAVEMVLETIVLSVGMVLQILVAAVEVVVILLLEGVTVDLALSFFVTLLHIL
jgi:hypothetical protein